MTETAPPEAAPRPPAATPPPSREVAALVPAGKPPGGVWHFLGRVGSLLGTVAVVAAGALLFHFLQSRPAPEAAAPAPKTGPKAPRVERAGPDGLTVPAEVARSLGVRTEPARAADKPRPLPPFQGTLAIDNNRRAQVHSRFVGEVDALGTTDKGETKLPAAAAGPRALRPGDQVEAGQLLAVVWSKDLGTQKSDLVDAILKLKLDRDNLTRYQSLDPGVVALKDVRAAEIAVRASENAVVRAESTLRTSRLTEDEIKAIEANVDKVGTVEERRALTANRDWARVEVRAPFAGEILEKNVVVGDVVDTAKTLFDVVDLSRLTIWVNLYEDDLPAIQGVPKPIPWQVRLSNDPDTVHKGQLERIGALLDSTQHTVPARGTVENPRGELRAGQFATAVVAITPAPGEVEIPTAGLVEDGKDSVVFVQPDPAAGRYERRKVAVTRRYHDVCYVRDGVKPGELIVAGGALQLKQALDDAPDAK